MATWTSKSRLKLLVDGEPIQPAPKADSFIYGSRHDNTITI